MSKISQNRIKLKSLFELNTLSTSTTFLSSAIEDNFEQKESDWIAQQMY
jgi:hypothetical protein